jgi:hypothetical protein
VTVGLITKCTYDVIIYLFIDYNILVLWQVLYPVGWLTLYGLTECIINEWISLTETSSCIGPDT